MARPRKLTAKLGTDICVRIAQGHTLRKICSFEGMPAVSSVMRWVIEDPEFAEKYNAARQVQAHILADEIIEISDTEEHDVTETGDGVTRVNHDVINRDRLRVDSRKWYVAKVLPKIYGDKQVKELTGPNGGPIESVNRDFKADETMDPKEASRRYKEFIKGE